jgi:RNA polymerase sigma-70 factor (ECF subfamily)
VADRRLDPDPTVLDLLQDCGRGEGFLMLPTRCRHWPKDGVPQNPEAWLLTAARRSFIDAIRHQRVALESEPTIRFLTENSTETDLSTQFPDERLKLLFVCAHPAIDPGMHTPLMLQTVLGLDAASIAQAFLIAPKTMGQRLFRAKTKIRSGGIPFEVPQERDLPERLDAVLEAIYAAFGIGWDDMAGADQRGRDLAEEAMWLARVLLQLMPSEAEDCKKSRMFYCSKSQRRKSVHSRRPVKAMADVKPTTSSEPERLISWGKATSCSMRSG